jgi:hypothetical protein
LQWLDKTLVFCFESDDIGQRRNLRVSRWRQRNVRVGVRVCTHTTQLAYQSVLGLLAFDETHDVETDGLILIVGSICAALQVARYLITCFV